MASRWQQLARARRIARNSALAVGGLQVAYMMALTAVDAIEHKRLPAADFPRLDPIDVPLDDDELTVFTYGADLYEAMLEAIDGATERVYFETYIWKADEWGQRFKDALIRAHRRGVEVRVIWDTFANLVVDPRFFRFPKGLHALRFPMLRGIIRPRNLGLDHRKLLIVDGDEGFIGGYNIGSLYATDWRDTHLRVRGPGAAELDNAFIDFWNAHRRRHHDEIDFNPTRGWFGKMWVHRNTPRISVYPIRNMYLESIDRASKRIWLTHAYLIPDDDLVRALKQAAKRGVDVRIIVPRKSNHVVADWLSRSYYTKLLRGGIRLFLYEGAMVHSKTATIDGVWSTIGTANLDNLSLIGNYEVNMDIIDESLAEQMEEIFHTDLSNCEEMDLERWTRRSIGAKLTEAFLSPWRPFF